MIVIAAPMKEEVPAVLRRGAYASARVCVTGVGETNASSSLESFLDLHPDTDGVLLVGFATALRDELCTGDLVAGRRVLAAGDDQVMESNHGLLRVAEAALDRSGLRYSEGDIVTVGGALLTVEDKLSNGEKTGALVATMEDYWLAGVCARRSVPFLSVRSVLDLATQELPAFVTGLGGRTLPLQIAGVALNLAMRPRHIPAVANLRKQRREAQDTLFPFVISFLDELGSRSEATAVGVATASRTSDGTSSRASRA